MIDPANRAPTRTTATESAYFQRGQLLLSQATRATGIHPLTPVQFVTWFLASHDQWSRSTVRTYRASIREVLSVAVREAPKRSKYVEPALGLLDKVADPKTGRLAAPQTIRRPKRTSAGKRKSVTVTEFNAVDTALAGLRHQYALLARGYLFHTCILGLRPSEWPTAELIGTSLIVQNGKNTNDRANGPTRTIELDAYPERYIQGLSKFIEVLAQAAVDHAWNRVHAGIRRALRAASIAAGIPNLAKRPVTPYTCRHVAAARLKAAMRPAEVAALLGHATDESASIHYAPRSAARGWKPIRTKAPEGAEDLIRLRHVAFPERKSVVRRQRATPVGPAP